MDVDRNEAISITVDRLCFTIVKKPWFISRFFKKREIGTPTQHNILKDVSLNLPAGKLMGIIGSSGSGKVNKIPLFKRYSAIMLSRLRYSISCQIACRPQE